MKYVFDFHLFSKRLTEYMVNHNMVDSKGKPDKIALYNRLNPNQAITEADIKSDRQKVTDKTRYIDNWLKEKNLPRLEDVISLCNALDCDFDYFFTNMKQTTRDLQYISTVTNLSESSIKYLENSKPYEYDLLDILLKNDYYKPLCFAIGDYLQTLLYKEMEIKDGSDIQQISDSEKQDIAQFRATKRFIEVLELLATNEDAQKLNRFEHDLSDLRKSWKPSTMYEQLVKTAQYLTSKEFQDDVKQAEQEWKKSGLSFNEYIEQMENKKGK